jgi:hypothetical protein
MSRPDHDLHDPNAGTDGPGFYNAPGQEGIDGEDAPVPVNPPKPKRGRPRCSAEPTEAISVRVPITVQDRIIHLATQRKQPVSEYLRDVMIQLFMRGR